MNKILVAYATMAGSTAEVAQAVGDELQKAGLQVDVVTVGEVRSIEDYDGVVLGGPMILGWHRACLRFLKKHRASLQHKPLAFFMLAMSLTRTGDMGMDGLSITVDEKLPMPPKKPDSLSFREKYARLSQYLRPALKAAHPVRPVSIGFFGGRLAYSRLKWWAVLFAMLIVQARAGDKRNWPIIRAWATSLAQLLTESMKDE